MVSHVARIATLKCGKGVLPLAPVDRCFDHSSSSRLGRVARLLTPVRVQTLPSLNRLVVLADQFKSFDQERPIPYPSLNIHCEAALT